MADLKEMLKIKTEDLDIVNQLITNPDNKQVKELYNLIEKFGGVAAINKKAEQARDPEILMHRLKEINSPMLPTLNG